MLGVVMLGPCRTSSLFQASTHRPRWLLPRAVCANTVKRHPSPPTAPAQQPPPQQQQRHSSISAPAALVALLPAAALLTPDAAWAASLQAGLQPELPRTAALYELADLDAKTAGLLARVLQPVLAVAQLLMIVRIVLSWYPQASGGQLWHAGCPDDTCRTDYCMHRNWNAAADNTLAVFTRGTAARGCHCLWGSCDAIASSHGTIHFDAR